MVSYGKRTLRWPRKCCNSLISLRARLAKIFLLNTLVTFLMATPSPVTVSFAALENEVVHQHCSFNGRMQARETARQKYRLE